MVVKTGKGLDLQKQEVNLRHSIWAHKFEIHMRPGPASPADWERLVEVERALNEILADPDTLSETIKEWYSHPRTRALLSDMWMALGFHIHKTSTTVPDSFETWVLDKLLNKMSWERRIHLGE